MRITNQMITRNALNNINRNKNNLSRLDEQYSSGKKIQRPSQDPIVAVRALKLRTNLSELNQFLERNIPDARNWMEVTQSALANINKSLTDINQACVQGANDPLNVENRISILKNLDEYKKQIYQEGNTNYAGRYVFTGYKTDTSLIFNENSVDTPYKITENFSGKSITSISKVVGNYSLSDYDSGTSDVGDFANAPTLTHTHRIQLSYGNNDSFDIEGLQVKDKDGNPMDLTSFNIETKTSKVETDPNATPDPIKGAYEPGPDDIFYLHDTGELILGSNVYEKLKMASDIQVSYHKTNFAAGDLRPEHYFNCEVMDASSATPPAGPTTATKVFTQSDQQIQYEVSFNQKLAVNTQGKDALVHSIGRDIDEIMAAAADLVETEKKISEVKKMLEDKNTTPEQSKVLNKMLEQLDTERVLKGKLLQDKFEEGIASSSKQQDVINMASADLASRYVRLDLTEDRLSSQQVDFEELMSMNEDVNLVDTYIRLSSAEMVYTASLSSAAKVVRNTLLDFL